VARHGSYDWYRMTSMADIALEIALNMAPEMALGSCLPSLSRLESRSPHFRARCILGKPCWPIFCSWSMEIPTWDNWTLFDKNSRPWRRFWNEFVWVSGRVFKLY